MKKSNFSINLTLTQRCNLNCSYCYEHSKRNGILPLDVAQKMILDGLEKSEGAPLTRIEFHGGEISLAFSRLKEICEWLWEQNLDRRIFCYAKTNGTLVHGEIAEWFKKNKSRFVLSLSIDGTKAMQDINRSNSYSKIDIGYFAENWPSAEIKMTVSPETINSLFEGTVHLHSFGFRMKANLAGGILWNDSLIPVYKRELLKLANWYLENPEVPVSSILDMPIVRIGQTMHSGVMKCKWCTAGENSICYDVDGKVYPCHGFIPAAIGDAVNLKDIDLDKEFNTIDAKCRDCLIFPCCATCYAQNFYMNNTVSQRQCDLCKFRKVEALAVSYLLGKMLVSPTKYAHVRDYSPQQILYTKIAIKEIQTRLSV